MSAESFDMSDQSGGQKRSKQSSNIYDDNRVVARRRRVLGVFGTMFTAGLAGCGGGSSNSQSQSQQAETTRTTSAGASTGSPTDGNQRSTTAESPKGTLQVTTAAEGKISYATGVNNKLAYIIGRGNEKLVYGERKSPSFGSVSPPLDVGGDIAYIARRVSDNTRYGFLRRGGQQVTKVTLDKDTTDGEDGIGGIRYWGVTNNKLLWATWRGTGPSSFRVGQKQINTEYDIVGSVTGIGDDIGYIGFRELSDKPYNRSAAVVVGGKIRWEAKEGIGVRQLKDIGGTPAYIVNDGFNGPYVQYGNQAVGQSYTKRSGGDVRWFGELNGNLAAIFRVAEDKIQNSKRDHEDVLWYNGEEIARHESIRYEAHAHPFTVGDKIAYKYRDVDSQGLKIGDEVISEDPFRWVVIDGEVAYAERVYGEKEGAVVVYQGRRSKVYPSIEQVFEVDGKLGFLVKDAQEDVSRIMIQS